MSYAYFLAQFVSRTENSFFIWSKWKDDEIFYASIVT